MARSRNKSRTELQSHDVTISGFNARFSIRAFMERGVRNPDIQSDSWLTLRGTLTEPMRMFRTSRLVFTNMTSCQVGTARPASVGAIIQIRPQVVLVLAVTYQDFDSPVGNAPPPEPQTRAFHGERATLQQGAGDQRVVLERADLR
jgi:hypothetical protein